jgi:hypothetical protein
MAAVKPPELAHRHVIESDPMTLTVGSIYGSRTQTQQERSRKMIAGDSRFFEDLFGGSPKVILLD